MGEGTNGARATPGAWGEDESKVFVEFGRVMVPGREEIERTFLDLIPAEPDEPFLGVELGTGTGWLSAAVLRAFPKARILGLDGSPEMLKRAAQLLAPYGDRAELRQFRLEEPSWTEALPRAVRVFLSSLVFHHLDSAGKRDLFARLFHRLEPGGALLFADVMEPRSECARRHFAAAWEDEVRRRSGEIHGDARVHEFFVRERWNIYDHPDPMDKPSTLPEQLRWIEEAGFEGVDVFWARAGHALLGGYRPGDAQHSPVALYPALWRPYCLLRYRAPAAAPSGAPAEELCSGRAMEHVRKIGQLPHPMGSPENAQVRRHIFGELGSLGLDPRGQTATVVDEYYGSPYDAATLRPEVPVVLRVVDHSYGLPNAPGVDEMRPADTVPEDDLPTTTRFADATLVGKRFDLTEQERPK